jgi:amidohydrolase
MHACGHDAHTSALLGVAKAFAAIRDQLPGDIVFLFQHAEELSPGGAAPMIADGALDGVDAVYGVHLWTPLAYGSVSSLAGPFMAAPDEISIDIVGKGGHGGLPHQAVDALAVGAHLVVNLQSIVSRNVDPTEPCVISVGSLHSGTGFNIIAERASLVGTVRTFSADTQSLVMRRIDEVAAATCAMFHADYTYEYKQGYPAVVNDESEVARFKRVASHIVPEDHVLTSPQIMAGEDFAYYLQHRPGCFMLVGAGNAELGFVHPHHHPRFDLDERSMLHSAKLLAAMALDRLGSK